MTTSSISILFLPVEIQENILSFLPDIEDQFNVSQISPVWEEIVLTAKSLRKERYEPLYSGISVNTFLKSNPKTSGLFIRIDDGVPRYMYRFRKLKEPNDGTAASKKYSTREPTLRNWEDKDITDSPFLDEPLFATQYPWFTWDDVCHPDGSVKKGNEMPIKPRMDPNPWGDREVTLFATLYIKEQSPVTGMYSRTKLDTKYPLAVEAKGATVRQAVGETVDILINRMTILNGPTSSKIVNFSAVLAEFTNKIMNVHISTTMD
ncbi:hypothetical protein TWF694_003349 [Orbilia ellipsospora]|uniref:F-box domain-containing protein n=1 Tax=Orbilia ellipsospora TaxID=2528407 RepID=A0AAV9WXX3_9PEZI